MKTQLRYRMTSYRDKEIYRCARYCVYLNQKISSRQCLLMRIVGVVDCDNDNHLLKTPDDNFAVHHRLAPSTFIIGGISA